MTSTIKIKLVVDRSRNRVLFADAGSEFVDVLLSFLTLPVAAIRYPGVTSAYPGCISTLCESVKQLGDSKLLKVDACHRRLLRPTHTDEFGLSYIFSRAAFS